MIVGFDLEGVCALVRLVLEMSVGEKRKSRKMVE
jgi:hypothetical protein